MAGASERRARPGRLARGGPSRRSAAVCHLQRACYPPDVGPMAVATPPNRRLRERCAAGRDPPPRDATPRRRDPGHARAAGFFQVRKKLDSQANIRGFEAALRRRTRKPPKRAAAADEAEDEAEGEAACLDADAGGDDAVEEEEDEEEERDGALDPADARIKRPSRTGTAHRRAVLKSSSADTSRQQQ